MRQTSTASPTAATGTAALGVLMPAALKRGNIVRKISLSRIECCARCPWAQKFGRHLTKSTQSLDLGKSGLKAVAKRSSNSAISQASMNL